MKKKSEIDCPVELFSEQEPKIERLTQAINQASSPEEKGTHAQDLLDAVNVLLDCEHYDETNENCQICRAIAKLRRKTARLVVKASHLDELSSRDETRRTS